MRPFPNVNDGRWQVSIGGGRQPLWARNGCELFYISPGRRTLMSVTIRTVPGFTSGSPTRILDLGPYLSAAAGRAYDVTPDGRRFLLIKAPGVSGSPEGMPATITMVLNWQQELKAGTSAKSFRPLSGERQAAGHDYGTVTKGLAVFVAPVKPTRENITTVWDSCKYVSPAGRSTPTRGASRERTSTFTSHPKPSSCSWRSLKIGRRRSPRLR